MKIAPGIGDCGKKSEEKENWRGPAGGRLQGRRPPPLRGLLDGFHAANLRDVFLEVALDAHLEGDVGGWAADAGPVEADADDLVGGDPDEFDIAAIGLDRRADEVDDLGDALEERGVGCGGGGVAGGGGLHAGDHTRRLGRRVNRADAGGGIKSW